VLTAINGQEALDMAARKDAMINVALLDLTMPALSGEDTLRELKKLRPTGSPLQRL
jgi:CheY-like chemotaxis protein